MQTTPIGLALALVCFASQVAAQTPAAPPTTQYPPPQPAPAGQYPPAQPAPAYGQPGAQQPAPAQQPPQQAPPYAQPAQPQPGYAQQQPAPTYASQPQQSYPPPPTSSGGGGFKMPDFSVRVDPLNWLFYGELRFELEVELLEWMTVEASPYFLVSEQPVVFNSLDELHQSSGGLGPITGGSLVASFWLGGDSFNGTSLRIGLVAQSITYETRAIEDYPNLPFPPDDVAIGDKLDEVTFDSSRLHFGIGSGRTWGWFTIGGGIGVEWDLGDHRRCIDDFGDPTSDPPCDDDQLQIGLEPLGQNTPVSTFNLYDPFHPLYLTARLSLGVVFDE